MVRASAPSLGGRRFKPRVELYQTLFKMSAASLVDAQNLKGKSTDNLHRVVSMRRRRKCPTECGEKSGAVVVTLLESRVSWEVMALPPSSMALFSVKSHQ